MVLTFREGSFVLIDGSSEKVLEPKAALRFTLNADAKAQRVFDKLLVKRFEAPSLSPPDFLDPHQVEGVNWILTRSRSYLAHAPGAGKTCQAIVASLMSQGKGQTVFIVPPSLVENWAREIALWTAAYHESGRPIPFPTTGVVGATSQSDEVDWSGDFIIVPDSMLTKEWVYQAILALPRIKFLAVDEASRFKEPSSERTLALFGGQGRRRYAGLVHLARHAVLMDGSPMPNRPMELWAPLYAMAPGTIDFMDMHEFGVEFCDGHFKSDGYRQGWDYRGASRQERLHSRLAGFMHVVTEDKLAHPERKRAMLFMNDPRTKAMRSWEKENLADLNLADIDEDMNQGDLARHRKLLGLAKVDWIVSYVKGRLADKNESLLIFAWHREVCRAIASGLGSFKPGLVIGGTAAPERERIFARFQARRCRVIVGNIGAMGRGHNLQAASRVVFGEFSWTDELNKQCEKRASRMGSSRDFVRCDYVVAPGSLDEVVLRSVFTKAKNVERVIG